MNELYLLEYSEEQRCFNFNNGNSEENSHGYKSLGKHTWEECTAFIEYMKNKYNDSDYPLLDEVKKTIHLLLINKVDMGEIADSLISGEFDYITGEYLGEAVGYPRTHVYGRREYMPPVEKKPTSKANVCISNMCKDRGFDNREKVELVAKFLYSKGYKQLPNLSHQYKIIHSQYKNNFRKFLIEQMELKNKSL